MVILGRARVSTTEQAVNSHALSQQKQRLIDAGVTEILETVESGSSRRQLDLLIDRVKKGDVTEVVATRIDRITRKLSHLQDFANLCLDLGVNLRILDQQIDLKTPQGKLMLNMLGSIAQWETDMLEDRVNHGWEYLRKSKRAPGIVPFGYIRDQEQYLANKNNYFDTDLTVWEVAKDIINTFLIIGTIRGTVRELVKKYGKRKSDNKFTNADFPRENGLKYWLLNPVIRGHIGYFYRDREKETILIPNNHEALISNAEYIEIKKLIQLAKRAERTGERKPLAGLVYCGICGAKYKSYKNRGNIIRWYCSDIHSPLPACIKSPAARNEYLEEKVIEELINRAEILNTTQIQPSRAVKETPEILQLKETINSLIIIPQNPAITNAISNLESQIAQLKAAQLESLESQHQLKDDLIKAFQDKEFWLSRDNETKRRTFRRFVSKVVVTAGLVSEIILFV
jgi:site-specific DNA recombinase